MKKEKIHNEIKTDSLLRDTASRYIRLIGDADRKARIMIVVNSILLTISVTLLTKTLHQGPPAWISLILLITGNMIALFYTILSVKPEIHISVGRETINNILHYKKTSEYSLKEYRAHLMHALEDNDRKIDAVIKELHYFGNLLTRKYKLLKIAHRCFYWGIALALATYLFMITFTKPDTYVGS